MISEKLGSSVEILLLSKGFRNPRVVKVGKSFFTKEISNVNQPSLC